MVHHLQSFYVAEFGGHDIVYLLDLVLTVNELQVEANFMLIENGRLVAGVHLRIVHHQGLRVVNQDRGGDCAQNPSSSGFPFFLDDVKLVSVEVTD